MDLPDLNLWLAIIDHNHSLHASSNAYWRANASVPKAFCRVTMLGFLRLGTRPGLLSGTLTAQRAWQIYHQFLSTPNHVFLAEPTILDAHFQALTTQLALPHRMWTDAYLAAFAIAGGHRLVSFDSDFSRFPGLNFLHLKP